MPEQNAAKYASLALGVGLALLVVSFIWPWVVRPEQVWTEERALEYQAASASLHELAHSHHHHDADSGVQYKADEPPPDTPEMAAARQRFDQARELLESARTRGRSSSYVLRGLGVLIALSGLFLRRGTQD